MTNVIQFPVKAKQEEKVADVLPFPEPPPSEEQRVPHTLDELIHMLETVRNRYGGQLPFLFSYDHQNLNDAGAMWEVFFSEVNPGQPFFVGALE
jgi:hypothetical protein